MGNGRGATVFEWLNCPICQEETTTDPIKPLSTFNPRHKEKSSVSNFPLEFKVRDICTAADFDSLAWCDFETVAEDPCCDDVLTVSPAHVHGCHHPTLQCHPMPWERLINICIQVILIPRLPSHAMSSAPPGNCLQWLETLEEGGLVGRVSSGRLLSNPKVFQRPAIPKIDNNFLSLHLRFLPSQWSARPHALGTLPVVSGMP